MNGTELTKICNEDKIVNGYFQGVYPIDLLPKRVPYPCCFIANTKPSGHEGEHWIAIHCDENKRGNYFCSYGREPKPGFKQWLNKHTEAWKHVQKRIQGNGSTTCGQYAACYLHFRCRDVSTKTFLSLFSRDLSENDQIVTAFINGYYDEDTKVLNESFINKILD
jgi:hypothetical protein